MIFPSYKFHSAVRFLIFAGLAFGPIRNLNAHIHPKSEGKLYMKIHRARFDFIPGIYRSRIEGYSNAFGLGNQNWLLQCHFPFSHALTKINAEVVLMELQPLAFLHVSNQGNYGLGIGNKISFQLSKNLSLSYQGGIGWFDTNNTEASDGLIHRGFNFHHNFSIAAMLHPQWQLSFNLGHVSNGGLLGKNTNVQDFFGPGISYRLK